MSRTLSVPKVATLTLCAVLTSCSAPPPPATQANEQVLNQLNEMHKEVKALRNELAQLRQAVTEMHRAAVPPPAAAVPAPPATTEVKLDQDDPILGDRGAKVGIVEFSDYQCPFCVRHHTQTFPKLKETYVDTGKVQYIYRDFPLDFHAEAKAAASAANCAGRQDAYWGMHHALFTHQGRLGPGLFEELAKTLGLDVSTFLSCIQGDEQDREVSADVAYGQSLKVNGTPTFFVGCIEGDRLVGARQITGAQSFQAFAPVIDSLLKSTSAGRSCGAQVAGDGSDRRTRWIERSKDRVWGKAR